jgi:hypothetical protein
MKREEKSGKERKRERKRNLLIRYVMAQNEDLDDGLGKQDIHGK